MSKFKCNDCGQIFVGNFATQQCPNCGSTNFKKAGSDFPWKKILIAVGAILVLLLLIMIFAGGDIKMEAYLTNDNQSVKIKIEGISENDLRKNYRVMYSSSSDQNNYQQLLFGNEQTAKVSIATLDEGETYTFYVVERNEENGMKEPDGLKWKTTNQYTRPLPPSPPKISVETSADCHSGTYTVTIKVIEGSADKFYLEDEAQSNPVFNNVAPRNGAYFVKVYDSSTQLESEIEQVFCPAIKAFHVDIAKIQEAFRKVGNGTLRVGDAMSIINNGKNIKLTKPVDGNKKLEGILNYAYNNGIQYKVTAEIEHGDCSDRLKSITVFE